MFIYLQIFLSIMAKEPLFIDRYLVTGIEPPLRGYIHNSYGGNYNNDILEKQRDDAVCLVHQFIRNFKCADFLTAIHWREDDRSMIDFHTYFDIDIWPGNPKHIVQVYDGKNLEIGPGCEDSDIILARDTKWRRGVPADVFRNEIVPYESISDILF